jgi:hypothetical protein
MSSTAEFFEVDNTLLTLCNKHEHTTRHFENLY